MERVSRWTAVAALVLALAAPASAKPKFLNYRRMRKKPAPAAPETSTATVAVSSAPVHQGPKLMAGRWSPEIRAAVEDLMTARGKGAPGYDPKMPPVAVLPWSDAVVSGDPAELVFLRLVTDAKFRVDDAWWALIPVGDGRQPTRAAYESFIAVSSSVWTSQPSYHAWRKGMLSSYLQLCRGVGRKECRSYLARLWAGWRFDDAEEFARSSLDDEKSHAGRLEIVPGEPGDRKPLRARRGLRVVPEMRDLVAKLLSAGFDVWVVDDVPQTVLKAATAGYGIDPSRVYGIQSSSDAARIGADVLKPVPTHGGKVEAVQASLGRPADLAIGRDGADFDVLNYGDGLRIALDVDPELVKKAKERGWLIQRALAR